VSARSEARSGREREGFGGVVVVVVVVTGREREGFGGVGVVAIVVVVREGFGGDSYIVSVGCILEERVLFETKHNSNSYMEAKSEPS